MAAHHIRRRINKVLETIERLKILKEFAENDQTYTDKTRKMMVTKYTNQIAQCGIIIENLTGVLKEVYGVNE